MGKFIVVFLAVSFIQIVLRESGVEMGGWKWLLIIGLTLLWQWDAGDLKEENKKR